LTDTDSDTLPDGKEVANATDPNCPEGKFCAASPAAVSAPAAANPADLLSGANFGTLSAGGLDASALGSFDAKQLRAMLKAAGMADAQLQAISDEELLSVYADVLASGGGGDTSVSGAATSSLVATSTSPAARKPVRVVATSTSP
jgi:hypothetical protein